MTHYAFSRTSLNFRHVGFRSCIKMNPVPLILQLRSETKPLERRSACMFVIDDRIANHADRHNHIVTPGTTKQLIDAGYVVKVERSPERIFDDKEFEDVGAILVPGGSWVNGPNDNIIVGLKELQSNDCTLCYFVSFYKGLHSH
jgi:saccharopine dehydrogenase (NAD+, L-lysine forming)